MIQRVDPGERKTVISADGTSIGLRCVGGGTPLVMVHGVCGRIHDFRSAEPALSRAHEVWVFDRRGRGWSGDAGPYALEREVEDLLAVLDAAGDGAHLFAHSFGGLIALLAAPQVPSLRSLTIYEPAVRGDRLDPRAVEHAQESVAAADLEAAIDGFFDIAGITPDETAALRGSEATWAGMLKSVVQLPRELEALSAMGWDPDCFGTITAPTLMVRLAPAPNCLVTVIVVSPN